VPFPLPSAVVVVFRPIRSRAGASLLAAAVAGLLLVAPDAFAQPAPELEPPQVSDLTFVVERFSQDRSVLHRFYSIESPRRRARVRDFYGEWVDRLEAMDYDALNLEGKIDWVLLRNRLRYELERLEVEALLAAELEPFLPFDGDLVALHEARRDLERVDPREAAEALHRATEAIEESRDRVQQALRGDALMNGVELTPVVAMRAVSRMGQLRQVVSQWYGHFSGYDPMFTWWVAAPYEAFGQAVDGYVSLLRREGAGIRPGEEEPIIGDPLGRDALVLDLQNEMIAYSPEELIEVAEAELAWGQERLREASRELGFGDDWHAALEHVKTLHVEPGEQIHLVTELAREAEEFLEERDLVTVPPLAREIWRMEMLSPARQRIAPFFLGGEVVQVAFPTDEMTHEEKLMSLRANNEHMSRAVVHHELIPGHHLQGFHTSRYSTHRSAFSTPFWGEGWALYWELLLWDLDFPRGPEDEIGMLVWRNHRAARILFSLAFHMEQMTPQEAIELLVETVGFERAAAEAEVRRSFGGSYSPLYQAGYLLGGLQLRDLHREMVESGRVTNREFHDHILRSGRMPIEMVRASVTGEAPPRDFRPEWRFHPAVP
jgi:hypothetical protein